MQLFILSGGYADIYPGEKFIKIRFSNVCISLLCVLCLERKIVHTVTRLSACSVSFWSFQRCLLYNEESIIP